MPARHFLLRSIVLLAGIVLAPATSALAQTGEILDPSGDSTGAGGTADLVSAKITVVGPDLRIEVRFAPGKFNAAATSAQFLLDTDENPATGEPGTNGACTGPDAPLIGVDWGVELLAFDGGVTLLRFFGCHSLNVVANTLAIEKVANGMNLTLPRALIGNDDGRLRFKVVSYTQLSANSFTGVEDNLSDPGLPVGIVEDPDLSPCVRDASTACLLDDRFEVEVSMWNFATPPVLFPGHIQTYQGVSSETEQSVSFYSFQDGNVELFVKMVDACASPSFESFWLFAAGATNAETEIRVRDTTTGETRLLQNPRARLFETVADTQAFLACP